MSYLGEMENSMGSYDKELNLKATELRLGLPGSDEHDEKISCSYSNVRSNKRSSPDQGTEEEESKRKRIMNSNGSDDNTSDDQDNIVPPSKAQVVGWPPIRSFRKNSLQQKKGDQEVEGGGKYVKVSMAGAPYLRKIDLNVYKSYPQLLKALEVMFKCTFGEYSEREGYNGSEYAPTYEDKDGDWMLVGDVPWNMFIPSCKMLKIVMGSEAKGLGCL